MTSELLEKWLAHYDPIHRGWTLPGIANGVCATGGWSFPRVKGGYNLYRGEGSASAIDFDHPIGASGRNASSVSNFGWRPHAASGRYFYAVRSIGGGGVESAASWPARAAEFDGGGALLGLRPNTPAGLAVRPIANGRFEVRWMYGRRFEEAEPAEFRVYHDAGTGVVDYGVSVGTVAHRRGQVHFVYVSESFAHDARRVWSVRAVTAEGVDDGNTATVLGWADVTAPASHPAVRSERLGEEEAGS